MIIVSGQMLPRVLTPGVILSAVLVLAAGLGGCAAVAPAPVSSHPVQERPSVASAPSNHLPQSDHSHTPGHVVWVWPMDQSLAGPYQVRNRGIDFTPHGQTPVFCAADGIVTYVGNSIKSYGEMVIVKHGTDYLSVYANNGKVLVHEGQPVQRGERLATTLAEASSHWHFEIRYHGKPVDPKKILPR